MQTYTSKQVFSKQALSSAKGRDIWAVLPDLSAKRVVPGVSKKCERDFPGVF
jgi:hypothetical protein